MKKAIEFLVVIILFTSCKSVSVPEIDNLEGVYKLKNTVLYQALSDDKNYKQLTLFPDKTYLLSRADVDFSPAIEQCEYASKGQWKKLSSDVIDLTSENYYSKQEGFKYDLKQESKLSQDSVYIDVILPKDFEDVATPEFDLLFNYKTSKRIRSASNRIKLSKKDYSLIGIKNQLTLNLMFNAKGERFFNNRLNYNILQDYNLDTNTYNYFIISLPNFNQCFYDFEPYYHSYIYVKDKNTLMWKGEEWIRR